MAQRRREWRSDDESRARQAGDLAVKILQHAADEQRTVAHTCRYFGTATRGAPHSPRLPPTATGVTMSRLLNRASGGSKDLGPVGTHIKEIRLRAIVMCLIGLTTLSASPAAQSPPAAPLGNSSQDFGGIRTFLRAPHVRDLAALTADGRGRGRTRGSRHEQSTGATIWPARDSRGLAHLRVGPREWLLLHRHRADRLEGCAMG